MKVRLKRIDGRAQFVQMDQSLAMQQQQTGTQETDAALLRWNFMLNAIQRLINKRRLGAPQ